MRLENKRAIVTGAAGALGRVIAEALAAEGAFLAGFVALRLTYPDFPWPPQDEHIQATLDMIFHGCAAG